jgi:hypothetical protein
MRRRKHVFIGRTLPSAAFVSEAFQQHLHRRNENTLNWQEHEKAVREVVCWPAAAAQPAPLPASGRADPRADMPTLPTAFFSTLEIKKIILRHWVHSHQNRKTMRKSGRKQLHYSGEGIKYGVRSPKFIWAPLYSCTHWLRPPPPPPFGLIYKGPIGQPR